MISGHRPFAGDLSSLLYKVVHALAAAARRGVEPHVSGRRADRHESARQDADERYQTAAEMLRVSPQGSVTIFPSRAITR